MENDNGYHIRIDPEKNYIFFGDVDGHPKKFKDFAGFIIQFLKNKYSIDVLEKDKLVIRVPDANDRRKKNLVVTKKGAELHKELMKIEDELTKELKDGITDDELKMFIDVLMRIKMNAMK